MTSQTDDIHAPKPVAPTAPTAIDLSARIEPPVSPRPAKNLPLAANILTWAMIAIFLIGGGTAAFRAGMNARQDLWESTRSIRFKTDISRGFEFGNDVMRHAETLAGLEPLSDALANQNPKILERAGRPELLGRKDSTFRRMTIGELLKGEVDYFDSTVQDHKDRNDLEYDLDYPPLRLAVMTLWVRAVQRTHPDMDRFPQPRSEDNSPPQDEDVAEPILKFNSYCAFAAALIMFALVWVWMNRSTKPAKPTAIGRWWRKRRGQPEPILLNSPSRDRGRWIVPHGIFAFMLATGGFWYAYATLVRFPPQPAPVVSVSMIDPGATAATAEVTINSQNLETRWHLDFGPNLTYGQSTPALTADTSLDDQALTAQMEPLTRGQTVHFRVSAINSGGTTNSDDFSFINDGDPITINRSPVGGLEWPGWTVWLRLLFLFIAMVASAQLLPPVHRAWACAAVAAMLVWFDPMILIDSHSWPQWDVWILPMFLGAALLASVDWWMSAGILLGIGCMLKGQLLLGGPILLLWPLFGGRWGAFARILTGCLIGAEFVTWPWIVNTSAGLHWIELAMFAAALILGVSFMRKMVVTTLRDQVWVPLFGRGRDPAAVDINIIPPEKPLVMTLLMATLLVAAIGLTTVLLFHGMRTRQSLMPHGTMGWFLLLVLLPPWFLPRRSLGSWLAGVFAVAVWISSLAFDGSYSWIELGFAYGSVKHDQMQMSVRTYSNLASILSQTYHWDIHDIMGTLGFSFTTPGPWRLGRLIAVPSVTRSWSTDLDVKTSTALLYGIALVISSAAAAVHSRRNDKRFLVTLVVPWIVFPMVMCQMGSRYPIWASAISAAMVAVSMELSLLHIVLATFAFSMVARQLVGFNPQRLPQIVQLADPMFPDIAWMLVLVAAIFLVASCVPSRRKSPI